MLSPHSPHLPPHSQPIKWDFAQFFENFESKICICVRVMEFFFHSFTLDKFLCSLLSTTVYVHKQKVKNEKWEKYYIDK